jgi:hypothetical protein
LEGVKGLTFHDKPLSSFGSLGISKLNGFSVSKKQPVDLDVRGCASSRRLAESHFCYRSSVPNSHSVQKRSKTLTTNHFPVCFSPETKCDRPSKPTQAVICPAFPWIWWKGSSSTVQGGSQARICERVPDSGMKRCGQANQTAELRQRASLGTNPWNAKRVCR